MTGYRNGGVYTQPKCKAIGDDGKHVVIFDYLNPYFEDDLVHVDGKCIGCKLEFQKTYQQTEGFVVVAKTTRTVFDFNHEIQEMPTLQTTQGLSSSTKGVNNK